MVGIVRVVATVVREATVVRHPVRTDKAAPVGQAVTPGSVATGVWVLPVIRQRQRGAMGAVGEIRIQGERGAWVGLPVAELERPAMPGPRVLQAVGPPAAVMAVPAGLGMTRQPI